MSDEAVAWCGTHDCPTVVYDDDSFGCWWALVCETGTDNCAVVPIPATVNLRLADDLPAEES